MMSGSYPLNYTAIDFETANEQRASACSMGLVVIRNGTVAREEYFLIRPKEMRFTEVNVRIHGITKDHVIEAPEFPALWKNLSGSFQNELLLAHNADFDVQVLHQTLDAYGLARPKIRYACTQKLAQEAFKELNNYRLPDVAAYIGFELNHHDALSDARAAAAIGIKAFPQISRELFQHEHEELTYPITKIGSADKKYSFGYGNKHIDSKLLKPNLDSANADNPFYNKKVVFTGDLKTVSRKEAAIRIQALGADINTAISRKTQLVILGQKAGPSKLKKIEEFQSHGHSILVLEEEAFLRLLTDFESKDF